MATISVRKTEDGKVRYQAKVRLKGYPAQAATFHRKKEAERWAQSTEAALRERRYFKTAESGRRTVGELLDRYTREILPTKRSARSQRAQLAWWQSELGHLTLADLAPALVADCRDRLARGETPSGKNATPATQVRYLAALSHALSVAVREWGWLDDNPVRKVRRPQEPRGRVRFLSEEERTALLAACKRDRNPLLYPLVVLALSTGARLGETPLPPFYGRRSRARRGPPRLYKKRRASPALFDRPRPRRLPGTPPPTRERYGTRLPERRGEDSCVPSEILGAGRGPSRDQELPVLRPAAHLCKLPRDDGRHPDGHCGSPGAQDPRHGEALRAPL